MVIMERKEMNGVETGRERSGGHWRKVQHPGVDDA